MSNNALLEAALEYARRGWHVLPLKAGQKVPNGELALTDIKMRHPTSA
jgi:hypothetical protein